MLMKRLFIIGFILAAGTHAHAQLKTAQAYYDYIIQYQEEVETALVDFSNSLESDSATLMYDKLRILDEKSSSLTKRMDELEPYQGDSQWKNSVKELYSFYHQLCKKEYVQIIDYSLRLSSLTESEFDELTRMMNAVTFAENELIETVNQNRQNFIKKYGPVKTDQK